MTTRSKRRLATLTIALLLGAAACGDDDGSGVREIGDGSGSASGSASGSGSGSASGSAAEEAGCVPFGDPTTAQSVVAAELDEFTIMTRGTATAGSVHFAITNAGEEPHEMAVVRADSIEEIPTDENGSMDDAALPDGALIGEVEPFPGGASCHGTFELEAGDYVLLCAIVEEEDGQVESHMAEGMATTFTVG
jgi:hypothetical protein